MLPKHLIHEFWVEVEDRLAIEGHDRAVVRAGIEKYRAALTAHGVDDMIYHQSPEDVAQAISQGFLPK